MKNEKEKFIALVDNEPLKKADAIVLLRGDGFNRIEHAVDLYKQKLSEHIVTFEGEVVKKYGSFDGKETKKKLISKGIPKKNIALVLADPLGTHIEARLVMKMVKENKWKKIIIISSPFHQYRAFLTFLKEMEKTKLKIQIINAPCRDLTWFKDEIYGRRIDRLDDEFDRIKIYGKKGDLATFKEAISYQEWKEKQK